MIARNKKAKFNYQLLDRFEAGISLKGEEVKVIKIYRYPSSEVDLGLSCWNQSFFESRI